MHESAAGATTLYRQLGGHEAIVAVVDLFTRRLAADTELARFFAHLDQERLRHHQATFLAEALDGPHRYQGRTLREAHRGLGLTAHHFRLVIAHFAAALGGCDVPEALGAEVVGRIVALRAEVIEEC
jgi:hemoglobin